MTKLAQRAGNRRANSDMPEEGEVPQPVATELAVRWQGCRADIGSQPQQ